MKDQDQDLLAVDQIWAYNWYKTDGGIWIEMQEKGEKGGLLSSADLHAQVEYIPTAWQAGWYLPGYFSKFGRDWRTRESLLYTYSLLDACLT